MELLCDVAFMLLIHILVSIITYTLSLLCLFLYLYVCICVAGSDHKKQLNKYVSGIIVDWLWCVASVGWGSRLEHKRALMPGLAALMSCCTEHEFSQIYALLDTAGKATFKLLHQQFNKTYKFTGQA